MKPDKTSRIKTDLNGSQDNEINSAKKATYLIKKELDANEAKNKEGDAQALLSKLNRIKQEVISSSTNPLVKNSINFIFHSAENKNIEKTKAELKKRINHALEHLNNSIQSVSESGYSKIKKGAVVYTHGYSPYVFDLLSKAKKAGTNFEVRNTEAKPSMAGRQMAEELSKQRIHVKQYADMALRLALKNADIVLIGADAISEQGQIYSSIGSELVAELAEKYDIPVYICADSWKFNPNAANECEKNTKLRSHKELWPNPPKKVAVLNYGFEKISPKLISGIITENGIFKPHCLISEIKKQNPWTFK